MPQEILRLESWPLNLQVWKWLIYINTASYLSRIMFQILLNKKSQTLVLKASAIPLLIRDDVPPWQQLAPHVTSCGKGSHVWWCWSLSAFLIKRSANCNDAEQQTAGGGEAVGSFNLNIFAAPTCWRRHWSSFSIWICSRTINVKHVSGSLQSCWDMWCLVCTAVFAWCCWYSWQLLREEFRQKIKCFKHI